MLAKLICGNHFIIRVNQTIMLYALNFYNDICHHFSIKLEKMCLWSLVSKQNKTKPKKPANTLDVH